MDVLTFLRKTETHGLSEDECWSWGGAGKGNGYGNVNVLGRTTGAHRVSYQLFVGDIPDGMDVCHKCDNRWCVNPRHLFVGSRSTNMKDMKLKGRGAGGNRKHLKETHIQEIRRRLNAGARPRDVAEQMGVNYSTVTAIARGSSYVSIGQ